MDALKGEMHWVSELLAGLPAGSIVKVAHPQADRVFERAYRLGRKEDGTQELQEQTFVTDQMTILCGGSNPLESTPEADARRSGRLDQRERERMASQRANDDLMLKYSELQDENDDLRMRLEDVTRSVEDLYDRLHPHADPSPEEAKALEDLSTSTTEFLRSQLTQEGLARKLLPPKDVPTEFVSEGIPDDPADK